PHILAHLQLVLSPGSVHAQDRDAPRVGLARQFDVVVLARQTFPLGTESRTPGARIVEDLLQFRPQLRPARSPAPPRSTRPRGQMVATHESESIGIGREKIAEARDDAAGGTAPL